MVLKTGIEVVDYKPLRSDSSLRVTLDFGEVSGAFVSELHDYKMSKECAAIICTPEEFIKIVALLESQ